MVDPISIETRIYLIGGQKVMLDRDLAELYGIETRVLNQAVRRNLERFPSDFMVNLSEKETVILISQSVISSSESWGGRRKPLRAFTEHGILMLSSVLNHPRAVQVNIEIMRAFVRMRRFLSSSEGLAKRLEALEASCEGRFKAVFDALRQLMRQPKAPRKRIGFQV
ncbi:MAG: ORF6N domain-containing protein [Elusimicrobia bacterium]|nr:ORF6N domain-containing protein [Elusimicrobiota bacterium]